MLAVYKYTWLIWLFIGFLAVQRRVVVCETYANEITESMGFAFEYKIHIDPGKSQCYYQFIKQGFSLYVAFEVMRGGDSKASFSIRNPVGTVLMPHAWRDKDEYQLESVDIPGFYEFCLDNSYSRFAPKLVSFYATSYKRDEWEKFVDDALKADSTVTNITTLLQNVDQNIGEMHKFIAQSKRHMAHDTYLVDGNNSYVQNWSLLQCFVIIVASVIQVYFLKSFFQVDGKKGTGGMPRA